MTIHNFKQSLEASAKHAEASWWMDLYRKAFPRLEAAVSVHDDGWAQRGGIDRILTLGCGRVVTIDEKVRERDYGDILLEYWSDERRQVRGWVCKPLACDFIAYAIAPTKTCYLLPTLGLQEAWRQNAVSWHKLGAAEKDGFGIKRADNGNYVTVSLAVPKNTLLDAIRDTMVVQWGQA